MICGSLNCNKVVKYELLEKSNQWYAGVKCKKCEYTHRISPLYHTKRLARSQVDAHQRRVSK